MSEHERQNVETPQALHTDVKERRQWQRTPDDNRSRVWFSTPMHGALFGRVEDLSLGGFAMKVSSLTGIQVGQKLVVGLEDWLIPAYVRGVLENSNGSFRIALEWLRPESNAVVDILEKATLGITDQ